MSEAVVANVDNKVDVKEVVFGFKTDKMGNKRPSVKVNLTFLSPEGIAAILNGGDKKQIDLLVEACSDVVTSVARGFISDDEKMTAETFPYDKVTWEAIANQPKEDRRSNSIPEETWTAFCADYIAVMQGLAGKTEEQVTNATIVYRKKFAPWKSDKGIIKQLVEQLALYAQTPKASEYADILELLVRRADAYLKADDLVAVASNL
jgi:hypothetical protein